MSLDIPLSQTHAVCQILACVHGKSIAVKDLDLDEDEVKLSLVQALHQWGAQP
jgi:hypothetical protein